MNTKNNRRRRESEERIEKAFIELLQTRELNEVTVSDICKRCGLNRSTFYSNYADIYDLADRMRAHLEEEVDRLYEAEQRQNFNSNDYLRLFRHIKENQLFYRTYFKLGYDNQFRLKYYDVHQAERHFNNQYIGYHMEFFRCGFNAIVKLWLQGGCKETPEEMDGIIRLEYQGRTEDNPRCDEVREEAQETAAEGLRTNPPAPV